MSKNNLGVAFSKSDDRIMCIFPAQAHWALLWGQLHVDAIHWLYCDGLPGRVNAEAMRLAARNSEELSLDWSIDPGHLFSQHDDHTCGTIALLMDFLDSPPEPLSWTSTLGSCTDLHWVCFKLILGFTGQGPQQSMSKPNSRLCLPRKVFHQPLLLTELLQIKKLSAPAI